MRRFIQQLTTGRHNTSHVTRSWSSSTKTDNSKACGFANDDIRQKRSKPCDMRFEWLRCRENQEQLNIFGTVEKRIQLIVSLIILVQNII